MRFIACILLCGILSFSALAQKDKTTTYLYTAASERYFTDAEMDSLLYATATAVFEENKVPLGLLEKKYSALKSRLITLSKKDIIQAFKWVESTSGKSIRAEKGTVQFEQNKNLYREYFVRNIRRAFWANRELQQYLVFNNSDRITYFNSIVRVQPNGKLLVEENISIYNGNGVSSSVYGNDSLLSETGANNNEIKRGIVRAFPLYYINKYKLFQNTTFKLISVKRDGHSESYHTENHKNGILVYTGSSSVFIKPGYYTYTITYETGNQLKFLKDFDELYWNVTGNGWSFRIDSAACTVILPKGAGMLSGKCYTGMQDEAGEECMFSTASRGDSTIIKFRSTRPFLPNQGLTIAVSWQKGVVAATSGWQRFKKTIWDNKGVFFLPIAALISALICFLYWLKYGRDPKKGVIYPQFTPPPGYSPAALGYIYYQGFDRQLTAATIVDAAVRNKIKIDVEREGWLFRHNTYKISKSSKTSKPPETNYDDFHSYVKDLIGSTITKGKYNDDLGDLNKQVQAFCESNFKIKNGKLQKKNSKGFFRLNDSYTIFPGILCVAAGAWGFFGGIIKALMMRNFWQLAYFAAGIILCVIVFRIFTRLLRAYNPAGRELMDKIEGFRMFLSTADEKRFDAMNPPQKTLELYEKYLPFAIALGCEIAWGERFESIIETAYLDGAVAGSSFHQSMSKDSDSFGSSFASSFSGAISSASTPPSSSSGGGSSFGGGSSGGGGGGGGGGGW